jgi:hypothetical protein
MGIRLVCPQGHKLHVKAFLAGKRAICPHCGEKVFVPMANEPAAASAAATTANAPETAIDLADVPTKGLGTGSAIPSTTASSHVAPAVVPATSASVAKAASVRPAQVATPVSAAVSAGPPPVPSSPPASDPIAENAGAVWYVRPTSGGQYGPAPGGMMRQWINESRVAADSLVWREGWDQWRVARDVFPQLAGGATAATVTPLPMGGLVTAKPVTPVVTGAPAASPAGAASAATVRYHARRRSTSRLVALIVVLGLLVVALAAVFVYVVQTRM